MWLGLGFLQREVATNYAALASIPNPTLPFHQPAALPVLAKLIQTPLKPGKNTAAIVREAQDWQRECTK